MARGGGGVSEAKDELWIGMSFICWRPICLLKCLSQGGLGRSLWRRVRAETEQAYRVLKKERQRKVPRGKTTLRTNSMLRLKSDWGPGEEKVMEMEGNQILGSQAGVRADIN